MGFGGVVSVGRWDVNSRMDELLASGQWGVGALGYGRVIGGGTGGGGDGTGVGAAESGWGASEEV